MDRASFSSWLASRVVERSSSTPEETISLQGMKFWFYNFRHLPLTWMWYILTNGKPGPKIVFSVGAMFPWSFCLSSSNLLATPLCVGWYDFVVVLTQGSFSEPSGHFWKRVWRHSWKFGWDWSNYRICLTVVLLLTWKFHLVWKKCVYSDIKATGQAGELISSIKSL